MNHQSNDCPKVIANALFEIQSKVGTLGYDSDNDYAKYRYVSIDKYYESIRPLMNDAGIMIIPDELESSLSEDRKLYRAVYQFTIIHKDGAVWNFPIRRSITLPFTGAQSAGSALSYVEKIAMRTIFKINSGEKDDADMLEQSEFAVLTQDQKDEIDKLVDEAKNKGNFTSGDEEALLKWTKTKHLSDCPPDKYENLISSLKRKRDGEELGK